MTDRILLKGGQVITMDRSLGDLPIGDVLIENGKIADVAAGIDAGDAEVIDASGMIIMPGFIDTHRHTWQSCARYHCVDCSPAAYFEEMLFTRGPRYRPEDVWIGTYLGALAAIDSGITTLVDWSHVQNSPDHADAAIAALRDCGIRGIFGHGWPLVDPVAWMVDSARPHPNDIVRLRKELSSDDTLVTLIMAARGPEMANSDTWKGDLELARSLGIRSTIHMGAFAFNGEKAAIAEMQRNGMLSSDLTFVHCNYSSDEEFRMMADYGITASLGVNVEMNAQGIGDIPLDSMLAANVRPSLSGDTEACGCGDMFTQMRSLLGYYRSWMGGGHSRVADAPSTITTRDVLEFATLEGARANALSHKIGSISRKKSADIIMIRGTDLNLTPVTEPVAAVVAGAHPGNVDTVMVEGRILKRAGKLLGVDLDAVRSRASVSQHFVLSEAGVE